MPFPHWMLWVIYLWLTVFAVMVVSCGIVLLGVVIETVMSAMHGREESER